MHIALLPLLLLALVSNTTASGSSDEFDMPIKQNNIGNKKVQTDNKIHQILVQFCTS